MGHNEGRRLDRGGRDDSDCGHRTRAPRCADDVASVPTASIDLPGVVSAQTALKQLTIDWVPGGHPPASFVTPHFDFHFYTITPAEIAAIDCKDERKPSAPPAGYALPDIPLPPDMVHMMGVPTLVGLCVPHMGMHGFPEAEIARTDVFEGTMVVGYYRGQLTFVEPMITKATLMKKTSFDLPIPPVPGFSGVLPRTFHADYERWRRRIGSRLLDSSGRPESVGCGPDRETFRGRKESVARP